MKKLQKGFTLIELMIVVAIIAILAAVAAPKFGQQLKKAKDAKALAVVGNWRSAINLEYADTEDYETQFSPSLKNVVDKGTLGATKGIESGTETTATLDVGTNDTDGTITQTISIAITGNITSGTSIDITGGKDTKGSTWSAY